jgi:hypothetical protein
VLEPIIGRQQSEMLGPQIHRELGIALRQNQIEPPPPVLDSYEVEYESPATQFQRSGEVVGISRTFEVATPFITLDPGLALKFNAEKVVEIAARAQGVPPDVIRTSEEYARMRAVWDRIQALQQATALGQGIARAGKDAAAASASAMPMGAEGPPAGQMAIPARV